MCMLTWSECSLVPCAEVTPSHQQCCEDDDPCQPHTDEHWRVDSIDSSSSLGKEGDEHEFDFNTAVVSPLQPLVDYD